jgi:hypothetical protein
VLDVVEVLPGRRDVTMVRKLERFLQDDRSAVHALVDEVDRHAGHLHAVLKRLIDRAEARKRGQQRRVDVHDPSAEAAYEAGRQELHEAREHHELHVARLQPGRERLVTASAIRLVREREHRRLDARRLRALEAARLRAAGGDSRDLDVRALEIIDQRLEVRPLAGDQHCDPKAHAAMRNTG